MLANTNWFNSSFNIQCSILERVAYDHSPLLFNTEANKFEGNRIFRFEDFWLAEEPYFDTVNSAWTHSRSQCFSGKLQSLKFSLLKWNKYAVGNLEARVTQLADEISCLQRKEESGSLSLEESSYLNKALMEHYRTCKQIETKWVQEARAQWLLNSDNNTKYFHIAV